MEPNSKYPLKKLGKNDQKVGVQVDRPAVQITINTNSWQKDTSQVISLRS